MFRNRSYQIYNAPLPSPESVMVASAQNSLDPAVRICRIQIPLSTHRRVPFFLATEEWVANNLPEGDYFFAWTTPKTVVCGRNQNISAEVNLDYCNANDIDVVRRRSGGGAIYSDSNNLMFSYITANTNLDEAFSTYGRLLTSLLCQYGFDAIFSGRNDISINNRKVAGNAFYICTGRAIAHGTMLIDIDAPTMQQALTPSQAKLNAKGVKSVPARVTCLKDEGLNVSIEEFKSSVLDALTSDTYTLTPDNIADIEVLEQRYYSDKFLRINDCKKNHSIHIDNIGEIEASLLVDNNIIVEAVLTGDFFEQRPVEDMLEQLKGMHCNYDTLLAIITKHNPISGLSANTLTNLFLKNTTNI